MSWREIAPEDATGIDCTQRPDLSPPVNEMGEVCPWPWDPQQLKGAPMGMYHCPYCGAMCVAGLPHPDYRDLDQLVRRACEQDENRDEPMEPPF